MSVPPEQPPEIAEINRERQSTYGHPADDFARTAGMLSALGFRLHRADGEVRPVSPADIAVILTCVKLSRLMHRHTVDGVRDVHGYMNCLTMVVTKEAETRGNTQAASSLP